MQLLLLDATWTEVLIVGLQSLMFLEIENLQ